MRLMNGKAFLDTNILVYAHTDHDMVKQQTAQALIAQPDVVVSTQVLQEFANVLNRKFKLSWDEVKIALDETRLNVDVHNNTATSIFKACDIALRYKFTFFDSLIISAAIESGSTIVYSEDLQHGQTINECITIFNPFA